MRIHRRPAIVFVLTTLVVIAAVGVALAARSSPSPRGALRSAREEGSTVNRGRAIDDARRRLLSFVPPPGTHRVRSLPKSLQLDVPFETIDSPRFIDLHATWLSSESVEGVRAYLHAHSPPGSHLKSTGEIGDRGGIYLWDYGYSWPELSNLADERELHVSVVASPEGSALRADAQATYVEPKPTRDRLPSGAGYLEARETLGHRVRVVGTASAKKIEATASLINSFSIVQADGPVECGEIPSERVTLEGIFRASRGGRVLAGTRQRLPAGFCDFIGVTIAGEAGRALVDERDVLTKSLQGLLDRKYERPLLAGISGF